TAMDKVGNTFAGAPITFTLVVANSPTVIGIQASSISGNNLTQSANVAAGNTIFVTVATDPSGSAITVTDSAGNTYSKDEDVANGSGSTGVRTLVFSWPHTTAFNGTVTVNLPSPTPVN